MASTVIIWNRLQLGRYIRAVTGHNNLLYHLHNIDPLTSPTCRFCLDGREEFNHLANDCPALWFERQTISAQNPEHSSPETWTAIQIVDFTYFPRINDAFIKPLYCITSTTGISSEGTQAQSQPMDQDYLTETEPDTDISVMDITSESSSDHQDIDSEVSVISEVD